MIWYKWFALFTLIICASVCIFHIIRLIKYGKPKDYALKAGDVTKGVKYSMTKAMNPREKESAYLHLPTYMAGMIYHAGTFLSFFVFILLLSGFTFQAFLIHLISLFLLLTTLSGLFIFIKRIIKTELRQLSNADDYISNLLVTAFQFFTLLYLRLPEVEPLYFLSTSALLLYLPVGKLKHLVYFFAARYHLGFFYGWRNVWPPNETNISPHE